MKSASPIGIESVTYGVQDLTGGGRFFEDFGLAKAESGPSGATYLTKERTAIHLRVAEDRGLPPPIESGPTVREVVWGVKSPSDLEAIAAELSRDRDVSKGPDGKLCSIDPNGMSIAFQVTQRKEVAVAPPEPHPPNVRSKFYDRAAPEHIAHVVFFTQNLKETVDFYIERLGFLLSDTLTGLGMFLRCSSDHHNLFLVNHERKGLNHVSFRLKDFDEIMGGKEFLEKRGWRPVWGPGRHVIGSNLFYYFANPNGAYVEYYADMDCITNPDAWIAREWPPGQESLAAWGPAIPEEFLK